MALLQLHAAGRPLLAHGTFLLAPELAGAGSGAFPDELVCAVVAGWQSDDFPFSVERGALSEKTPLFSVGAGTYQVQIDAGAFGTMAAANAVMANSIASSFLLTVRVVSSDPAAACTMTLIISY